MTICKTKPEHEVAYLDLCALVYRHSDKVDAEQLLAIASNMVGKIIALQDQRTMTMERALETVWRNIKLGNQQVIEGLKTEGNA